MSLPGIIANDSQPSEEPGQQYERFFRSLVENSSDAVAILDAQGVIRYQSGGIQRVFGYTPEEMLGRDPFTFMHPDDVPRVQAVLQGILRQPGAMGAAEFRWKHKNGTWCYVESIGKNLLDDPLIRGVFINTRDLTERKATEDAAQASAREVHRLNEDLERRVLERTEQLEAANQELASFAYSVSHDLRAPLRSVDGFSHILLESCGEQLSADAQNYLRRIRGASQRMAEIIDALLALSRLTRQQLEPTHVDLSAMATDIANDLTRDTARTAHLAVEPGVTAWGDAHLLRAVLENLLGNAWKFTRNREPAEIVFGRTTGRAPVTYYVRDNGAGFDMAYVDKLFGAFQRLHGTSEFEGNGIGLATVQRIVRRHGGRVWAEGIVDGGATFYFTLNDTLEVAA